MTHSFPTRRSSDLHRLDHRAFMGGGFGIRRDSQFEAARFAQGHDRGAVRPDDQSVAGMKLLLHQVAAPDLSRAFEAQQHYRPAEQAERTDFSAHKIAVMRDHQFSEVILHRSAILAADGRFVRSEEHTSELQSLMRISYAVFCLKKK